MICNKCERPIPDHLLSCEVCLVPTPTFPKTDDKLPCISLWGPWATLCVLGEKQFETRGWDIKHRGWIAIHATKRYAREWREIADETPFWNALREGGYDNAKALPRGAIIGAVVLQQVYTTDQIRVSLSAKELQFGNYSKGRLAWAFANAVRIDPIPCRGHQRVWYVPPEAIEALGEAVSRVGQKEKQTNA